MRPHRSRTTLRLPHATSRASSARPAHVVGASLGAAVAIELALTHPNSVRSLVLITPFVEANGRLLALLDAWCAAAGRTAPDILARMITAWMFSPALLADDARRERAVRGFASMAGRIERDVLARWAAGLRAWVGTRTGDLQRIAAPTLVITADDDILTPGGHDIAAAIPGAEHLAVGESGTPSRSSKARASPRRSSRMCVRTRNAAGPPQARPSRAPAHAISFDHGPGAM